MTAHVYYPRRTIRLLDIVFALLLGLLALLPGLLIALAIRLDSRGPALYSQRRLGLRRQPFTLFKFRTMYADAETAGPRWASADDPRVTRVGRLLRATRLDELPQLVNILKGELSFIGPRPIRRHFADLLAAEDPHYNRRFQVKPGLTGWAQLYAPYGSSVQEQLAKLPYDLRYCEQGLTLSDYFKLLLLTALTVVRRQGV